MHFTTIKNHRDFVKVSSSGVKRYSEFFIIFCAYTNESQNCTVGFTASRKVGNAVKRNFAKRRMRALIADFLNNNPRIQEKQISIVLIAKQALIKCEWQRLKDDFNKNLKIAIENLGH